MIRALLFLLAWIPLITAGGLHAAEPRQLPSEQDKARTISIFHHPIVMSPNFVNQPEGAVMVARDNWFAAPATQPEKPS